jgi:ABC-type Zn uptake system ZnuABC Zn-binding protein ZnuA
MKPRILFVLSILALLAAGCGQATAQGAHLQVVATTPILADVVNQVGGDHIQLSVLIPNDTDPHSFEPAPRDATLVAEADLVFMNGLGLEEFMQPLLADADAQATVVSVSDGVPTIAFAGEEHEHEEGEEHEGEEHEGEEHEHEHEGADPHVWMDPQNVKVWVENIVVALSQADPQNAAAYRANGDAYAEQLDELDRWAQAQIAAIPAENRKLVTDHESFGYFAEHYGFEIVGALIPSYSTLSEPSAGELAELEAAVRSYGVSAIFIGVSVNPALAERVAADTGVTLVPVYTESLSEGEPAASYIDLIRYDVEAIVAALQ